MLYFRFSTIENHRYLMKIFRIYLELKLKSINCVTLIFVYVIQLGNTN